MVLQQGGVNSDPIQPISRWEWGMGNGEWGMGVKNKEVISPTTHSPLPIPYSHLPFFPFLDACLLCALFISVFSLRFRFRHLQPTNPESVSAVPEKAASLGMETCKILVCLTSSSVGSGMNDVRARSTTSRIAFMTTSGRSCCMKCPLPSAKI